jgi:hypothetical protein
MTPLGQMQALRLSFTAYPEILKRRLAQDKCQYFQLTMPSRDGPPNGDTAMVDFSTIRRGRCGGRQAPPKGYGQSDGLAVRGRPSPPN